MSRTRRLYYWIVLIVILSACAHKQNYVAETTAPLKINDVDCVRLVITGDGDELKTHIDYCKNYQNADGISPLMMSAYKNQQQIMEILLAAGSDVHLKDQSGSDALFYAVNFHRVEMIKRLRAQGARITMNEFKVNALWIALQKSKIDIIKNLNPSQEELNLQGEDGWNAIYFAIRREEKDILDFLLEKGVQVNLVDSEGMSPYLFAKDEVKWDYAVKRLSVLTEPQFKKKN